MSVRRLRWQGEQRRGQLLERLQDELRVWLRFWSIDPQALSLASLMDDTPWQATEWRWAEAVGAAGTLRLGSPTSAVETLGGLLANAGPNDRLGLARRVGERALRDLLFHLSGNGQAIDLISGAAPSENESEARFGSFHVRLYGNQFEALLWLDCTLCEYWLPSTTTKGAGLQPRGSALDRERVTLGVSLDFGDATLTDINGLQAGDVLMSRTRLDRPFLLSAADGRRIASGRLFRQGDKRALQIEST